MQASRLFLVGGGAFYLVLWIYGLVIDFDSTLNFVSLNTADNWLHLLLGVGMIGIGLALGRTQARNRLAAPWGNAAGLVDPSWDRRLGKSSFWEDFLWMSHRSSMTASLSPQPTDAEAAFR